MKIAVLAWGSLVWNPNGLPLATGWSEGGPLLPVEFSRVSKDGRLTLVIDRAVGAAVPTRFARSQRSALPAAVEDLRIREGTSSRNIGFLDLSTHRAPSFPDDSAQAMHARIGDWLESNHFEAAIWTALPSNFLERRGHQFTVERATDYLLRLDQDARDNALDYIRKAPSEVVTPLRQYLAHRDVL